MSQSTPSARTHDRQQLHAIAAASPFPTLIHTAAGEILAANAEWLRLTGYDANEADTLEHWHHLVRASGLAPTSGAALPVEHGPVSDGYNVITTATGQQRICEMFKRQLVLDGETSLYVTTAVDVTGRLDHDVDRAKLTNLLEHSADMIALADLDGRLTYMNTSGRAMLGIAPDRSLRSVLFTDYVPADWIDRFTSSIIPTVLAEGKWEGDMQLQNVATGERIDVTRSTFLVRDTDGEPVGFGTVCRNITGRNRIEETLRRNAELIHTITENSTYGLTMMDERGHCTYANPAWLEMTGFTSEEISAAPLHDLVHHHYPDGRPFPMSECPIDRALPENFDIRAHQDIFFRKDGSTFPVQVAASPIFKDGRPIATVIEIRDMTAAKRAEAALRESEQQFRVLAENIPQLAWIADSSGWIYWYNQRWFEYTGTTLPEMEGWGWRLVHHPDHAERIVAAAKRGWDSGEAWEETFPLRRHDGEYRWFLTRVVPLRDDEGRLTKWLGTNTDITELRAAQEALTQTAEALRRADRLKDEFLATLSHELRTPLTAILGWTQMLKLGIVSHDESEVALDTIHRSAKAQADLIEDVLDISRITTGKMRLERRLMDPAAIAESALATIGPAAEAKNIVIRSDIDREIGPMYVDPDRLQQILWNLLSNAIKFSGRDSTVELIVRRAGENVEFIVRDEGAGISAAFLPYVFERFRQADSSTRRSFSGLGLGLALVKELVHLHGGTVGVESEEGKGSVFTISLPTGGTTRASDEPEERRAPTTAPLSGIHVLVVDDHPDSRLLITTIMRKLGAIATEAASVEHALSLMERARPHVVVSDIAMPEKDGFDLLRELQSRSVYARIPVIAMTAQVEREGEASATAAGFKAYLRKPIDPDALARAVAAVVPPR